MQPARPQARPSLETLGGAGYEKPEGGNVARLGQKLININKSDMVAWSWS